MRRWLAGLFLVGALARDVQQKAWYTSRTVWVNAVALGGWGLVQFGVIDTPWTEAEIAEAGMAILSIINLALRTVTDKPIGRTTLEAYDGESETEVGDTGGSGSGVRGSGGGSPSRPRGGPPGKRRG